MASSLAYLKGIDLVEFDDTLPMIQTVRSSVVGLIGTAGKGPVNTPVLILNSRREAVAQFGAERNDGFTIPAAINAIFDQGAATIVVVNVLANTHEVEGSLAVTLAPHIGKLPKGFIKEILEVEETVVKGNSRVLVAGIVKNGPGATTNASAAVTVSSTLAASLVTGMKVTGAGIPALTTIASIAGTTVTLSAAATATAGAAALTFTKDALVFTPQGATNLIIALSTAPDTVLDQAAINALPVNTLVKMTYDIDLSEDDDFVLNYETGEVRRVGTAGKILPGSTLTFSVSRVNDEVAFETLQDLIIGDGATHTGMQAFLTARNTVKLEPKIIVAPGFTHQKPSPTLRSPIVTALDVLIKRLKAVAYVDCADTNIGDAVAHRADFADSDRLVFLYPFVKVLLRDSNGAYGARPMSSYFAGMCANMDNVEGFWNSPSNYSIYGIAGLSREVSFAIDDTECEANYLAENRVGTIVELNGLKAWGNRTASGRFINQRRIADMVNLSIAFYHARYADRNITPSRAANILQGVQAYLDRLAQTEAVIGGKAWIDPELNTRSTLGAGELTVDFDYTTPSPLERLRFRFHLTDKYYDEVFSGSEIIGA